MNIPKPSTPDEFLMQEIRSGFVSDVQHWLDNGASPNVRDEFGNPAVCRLAGKEEISESDAKILKLLLEYGAGVDTKDDEGNTLLEICCKAHHDDVRIAQVLVEQGADINKFSHDGYAPLMLTAYEGNFHLFEFLLKQGADRHARRGELGGTVDDILADGYYSFTQVMMSGAPFQIMQDLLKDYDNQSRS